MSSNQILKQYTVNEEIVKMVTRNILIVTKKDTNKKFIMIKYTSISDLEKNEMRMFVSLPHNANLIYCHEIIYSLFDNVYYCLIDYAPKMTLHHFLIEKKPGEYISENLVWRFLVQMLYAVYPLHSNDIIHHNIKNSNFFLFDDYTIKLGGFKLCEVQREKKALSHFAASLNYFYAAPELINKEDYNTNSDVWSIGMCIYELCFPQKEFNQLDTYLDALQGKIRPINKIEYSTELFDIISLMLRKNKMNRPNVKDLLNHSSILSHVENPMAYMDVLSCGKGWISNISMLNDINDFELYINEYINKKNELFTSISTFGNTIGNISGFLGSVNNTSVFNKEKKKKPRTKRSSHAISYNTNTSQSDSFDHLKFISNKYHHKNYNSEMHSKSNNTKVFNKSRSVSSRFVKPSTPTNGPEIKLVKHSSIENAKEMNTSVELNLLMRKLNKAQKYKKQIKVSGVYSEDEKTGYNKSRSNPKTTPSTKKNKTTRPEIVGRRKIIDSSKINFNIKPTRTLIEHLVTPINLNINSKKTNFKNFFQN